MWGTMGAVMGEVLKQRLPQPIFDADPDLVAFYDEAWEAVASRLRDAPGLPCTPYLEAEAADGGAHRIADACYLALAAKYAYGILPGVQSLANFYQALYGPPADDSVAGPVLPIPFAVSDQASAPLFGWVEYETALISGDVKHVRTLLHQGYLQRHYEKLESLEAAPKGENVPPAAARRVRGYHWSEEAAGMPGLGRGLGLGENEMFWVDLLSQQCLSALCVSRLAALVCDTVISSKWRGKFSGKKTLLRRWYWNNGDSFFHDLDSTSMKQVLFRTPAGFWPLVAGCPDPVEAERIALHLCAPDEFGAPHPFPSVPRNDPRYDPGEGAGWHGAIHPTAAYLALHGLSRSWQYDDARLLALDLLRDMRKTWKEETPHGFWECYSPVDGSSAKPAPGRKGRAAVPDLTANGALLPINAFIENVIGIHYVDSFRRLVEWVPPREKSRVGLKNLRFGTNNVDLMCDGGRCYVRAAEPFTLLLNGHRNDCAAGSTILTVELPGPLR